MGIESTHPSYDDNIQDWTFVRDSYENNIKNKGTKYLPYTMGMVEDKAGIPNSVGTKRYQAYHQRALYPQMMDKAVEHYLGVLHQKPPKIELPPQLEYLRDRISSDSESAEDFLMRINTEQLISGRFGLLLDINTQNEFYISLYPAEKVINWDVSQGTREMHSFNLLVLDESTCVRKNNFEWEDKKIHRVLALGDIQENEESGEGFIYRFGVFEEDQEFNESAMQAQEFAGLTLDQIPFVIGNSKDITSNIDKPPLLSLCEIAVAIYRADADYRQNLHQQGQDTLVVTGYIPQNKEDQEGEDSIRVGTGSAITTEIGGDAKYIGTESRGLVEQRKSLENDKILAEIEAGQAIKPGMQVESGESVRRRLASQTATLTQISITGGQALERILKIAAEWFGLDSSLVSVKPNLEFDQTLLQSLDLMNIARAKAEGLPISYKSIHDYIKEKQFTELNFEEELAQLRLEEQQGIKNLFVNPPNSGNEPGNQNVNGDENNNED